MRFFDVPLARCVTGFRAAALSGLMISAMSPGAYAAEGGSGVYLLGFRGPAAGVTPPPGVYFNNQTYFYFGDANANFDLANDQSSICRRRCG